MVPEGATSTKDLSSTVEEDEEEDMKAMQSRLQALRS